MQSLYEPKGKAKEYGELALNIYTGCTHGCTYCYAPDVLHRDRDGFHANVEPRPGIIEATRARLAKGDVVGKEVFLCFTCDPFPVGVDHTPTYEIIRLIKESGNRIAILTKGNPDLKLFDMLDSGDRFGVTVSCGGTMSAEAEPNAYSVERRLALLANAKSAGIKTFVSCEPVLDAGFIYELIKDGDCIDEFRIGKLNYHPSEINWKVFGETCMELCQRYNRKYMIKEGLRTEMDRP